MLLTTCSEGNANVKWKRCVRMRSDECNLEALEIRWLTQHVFRRWIPHPNPKHPTSTLSSPSAPLPATVTWPGQPKLIVHRAGQRIWWISRYQFDSCICLFSCGLPPSRSPPPPHHHHRLTILPVTHPKKSTQAVCAPPSSFYVALMMYRFFFSFLFPIMFEVKVKALLFLFYCFVWYLLETIHTYGVYCTES